MNLLNNLLLKPFTFGFTYLYNNKVNLYFNLNKVNVRFETRFIIIKVVRARYEQN